MDTAAPGTSLIRPAAWFSGNIYWITCAVLFAVELIRVWQGHWIGDFWEHAAVIRELSRTPFQPDHPILNISASHSFYSPYSLLVAFFSRATGLSAIHALECYALVNLALYLLSFRFFCVSVFGHHKEAAYALALVFSLFFWGMPAEQWSGFHHFYGLHFVLPYPSVFALALSLYAVALLFRKINLLNLLLTTLISCCVLIIHPNTWLFLVTCLALIVPVWHPFTWRAAFFVALSISCAFFLAIAWPYFDLWTLLSGDSDLFHEQSRELYGRVAAKYWPVLLAIPAPVILPDRIKTFLACVIGFTLAIYTYGYVSGYYGLGRIISSSMRMTHLLLAYHCVKVLRSGNLKTVAYRLAPVIIAFFVCLLMSREVDGPGLLDGKHDGYYTQYYFLKDYVGADDLVLADGNSTWFIPAISGKVISWPHPLHFVADEKNRRYRINAFFDATTTEIERTDILKYYQPDFVLLDLKNSAPLREWVIEYGRVVYSGNGLELVSMGDTELP